MGLRPAASDDVEAVIALWRICDLTRPWNDPVQDFTLAVENSASDILLLHDEDQLTASVMVGFDGHRGWVYYLAVHPAHRRLGLGQRMMVEAETWLRARNAPKIQLMVRSDNADVIAFYKSIGLESQPVETLGKRLDEDQ